jgi:hypothetical protein
MSKSSPDHKKVLIIQYSQSGQLTRIIQQVSKPILESNEIETRVITLEPVKPYPFPWPLLKFFNIFPECVYLDPPELKPINMTTEERYDLILFSYQVWFLSPSLPATAFLKSEVAKTIFQDTPVITLIACRNMWTQAHLTAKELLSKLGAKLIDNIVLQDQGSTMASFVTTPRWLLTGHKDGFWGLPPAGVSDEDILSACRFGKAIVDGLAADKELDGQPLLAGLGAVNADVALIQSEKIGYRSFRIWGKLLRAIGDQSSKLRKIILVIYILFLIGMILTVVPVTLLVKWLLRPLLVNYHQRLKQEFEQPSGSGTERMEEFKCQN